jgi:hypothetical protein
MPENFIDYSLPKNAYVTFDATSLREFINGRLDENDFFTDHRFEGSNLSNIVEIISASFHTLLFYLNKTSSESLFSQTQLYENMNKIVKLIGYKPNGFNTCVLNFVAKSTLPQGSYIIPRYSFFNINGKNYSFIRDETFIKNIDGEETLNDFNINTILYQGKFRKRPIYTPIGENNEIIELSSKDKNIDSRAIDVYLKRGGVWYQMTKVSNLYFEDYNALSYEIRYNSRGNYEITFGDDIHGTKLTTDDQILIYYLECDGENGQVASDFLNGTFTLFSEPIFDEILSSIRSNINYISILEKSNITFSNPLPSTNVYFGETVDEIRSNAAKTFKSSGKIGSKQDFDSFIRNNYGGFISDVKVLSNKDFLDTHIKYYSDIGIKAPFKESRVMYNQYLNGNACNFNNVYLYLIPRYEQNYTTTGLFNFINPSQKQLIKTEIENIKDPTVEIIFEDPVYMAVDIGYNSLSSTIKLDDISSTKLHLVRSNKSVDKGVLINKVSNIFSDYFKNSNVKLGQTIDISKIISDILNISGLSKFYISNGQYVYNSLNLYVWNPIYPQDLISTSQNLVLDNFKVPFFNDIQTLKGRIIVEDI